MARGQVVHQKHDANGNLIGRSNQYSIFLETCLNKVEFSEEEMTELAANINAESIHASLMLIGIITCY